MGDQIFGMVEPSAVEREPSKTRVCLPSGTQSTQARSLHVHVIRSGRTKAQLTFPAAAAENLRDLIPPELASRLSARGIDLAQVSSSIKENGFSPGELFSLAEGGDCFRVWLE